jgi:hypothetical protein
LFVAVATAANAGVPADKAGLAASLLNASQQLGGALGLAILTAVATSQTHHQLAAHHSPSDAMVSGFQHGLFIGAGRCCRARPRAAAAVASSARVPRDHLFLAANKSAAEPVGARRWFRRVCAR